MDICGQGRQGGRDNGGIRDCNTSGPQNETEKAQSGSRSMSWPQVKREDTLKERSVETLR